MIMPILAVRDVEASAAFYTQKLGFNQDTLMAGPDGKPAFAIVSLGQAMIGLGADPALPARGAGVELMVYVPDGADLDALYAEAQARGVTVAAPIQDQYWGDRTFSVHDPDGFHITLSKTVRQVPMEEMAAIMRGEQPA